VKVGIVGLGTMGTTHAAGYQRIAGCELVAVADIQPERCAHMARRYWVRSYATLVDMLAGEKLDVVDVCVPTHLHREHVEMAAAAGKHVFCEKPLARNRTEGEAMVEACRKAGGDFGCWPCGAILPGIPKGQGDNPRWPVGWVVRYILTAVGWVSHGMAGLVCQLRMEWWRSTGLDHS